MWRTLTVSRPEKPHGQRTIAYFNPDSRPCLNFLIISEFENRKLFKQEDFSYNIRVLLGDLLWPKIIVSLNFERFNRAVVWVHPDYWRWSRKRGAGVIIEEIES